MNCYICTIDGIQRAAIGSCRHCQAPLCAVHLPERAREGVNAELWCCTHAYALPPAPLRRERDAA